MSVYRRTTLLLALVTLGLGVALLVVTAVRGGGVGYVLGALFLAAGAGRLYLARGRPR